jgi:hypothetical protein
LERKRGRYLGEPETSSEEVDLIISVRLLTAPRYINARRVHSNGLIVGQLIIMIVTSVSHWFVSCRGAPQFFQSFISSSLSQALIGVSC